MDKCVWTEDEDGIWSTDCKNDFLFIDGGPDDNKMKFCCFCGLPLQAAAYEEVDDSVYIE
jgi:hypothetical protein